MSQIIICGREGQATLQPRDVSRHFVQPTAQESKVLRRIIGLEATPEAIREFTRCRSQLSDYTYWFLLGTLWVSYTGFSDLELWKRLFAAKRPNREECLMKPSEYRVLQGLPESLIVYRAHRRNERDWISYTLNPQLAAEVFAPKRGVREIKAYVVDVADVAALFLRRGEQEVLVLDRSKPRLVSTYPLTRIIWRWRREVE